jgi:hypothetical protein
MRIDAFAFRSAIQLAIPSLENPDEIKAFASAFFLIHNQIAYLITADHVIHLDDYDPGRDSAQRTGRDYIPQIITNVCVPNELKSEVLPIGGFQSLTGYNLFDKSLPHEDNDLAKTLQKILDDNISMDDDSLPISVRIPDFVDVAFSEVNLPLPVRLLSNIVVLKEDQIIVKANDPKIFLFDNPITEFNNNERYFVAGTVRNKLKNSIRLERVNVLHGGLQFDSFDPYTNDAILRTPEFPNIIDWEGLSGAPIFNDEGSLAGMLIRGPKDDEYVTAVPINRILHIIDNIQKINILNH